MLQVLVFSFLPWLWSLSFNRLEFKFEFVTKNNIDQKKIHVLYLKYTSLKKSTITLVVAAVTNISYGGDVLNANAIYFIF